MSHLLSLPSAMGRYSTFVAITVGKSFCPRPPVRRLRKSLTAAAGSALIGSHSYPFPIRLKERRVTSITVVFGVGVSMVGVGVVYI
jgi:hypothetical protein